MSDREGQLTRLLLGKVLRLPQKDAQGKVVDAEVSVFYVGFSCAVCSGDAQLPVSSYAGKVQVVYLYPDKVGRQFAKGKVPPNVRVIEDPRLQFLGAEMYGLFPYSFRLDSNGKVIAVKPLSANSTSQLEAQWK